MIYVYMIIAVLQSLLCGRAGWRHGNGVDTSLQEEVRNNSDVQACLTSLWLNNWSPTAIYCCIVFRFKCLIMAYDPVSVCGCSCSLYALLSSYHLINFGTFLFCYRCQRGYVWSSFVCCLSFLWTGLFRKSFNEIFGWDQPLENNGSGVIWILIRRFFTLYSIAK